MKVFTIIVFTFIFQFCKSQKRIRPVLASPCYCVDNMIRKVCGKDGNTYNSKCRLKCAGVEKKYDGPCQELFTGEEHHGHDHHQHVDAIEHKVAKKDCKHCPRSDKNKKLCASDGAEYINECFMKCLSVKEGVKMLHEGRCYQNYMSQKHVNHKHRGLHPSLGSIFACLCVPAPIICASDGKSYEGVCVMKCYSLDPLARKVHDGPCFERPNLPMKPLYCACAKGAPLCASDGKTYYGDCNLRCAIANGNNIHKLHDGECSPKDKLSDVMKPLYCACAKGAPLCASDGETYYGICNFKCAIANGKKIQKVHDGECTSGVNAGDLIMKPLACACAPGAPLCASDGKTYYGDCNLKCAIANGKKIHKVHDGECTSGVNADDLIMKPLACACAPGAPLCASDGKTYYGDCNLKCAIANGKKIHKVHDGECTSGVNVDDLIMKPLSCACAPGAPLCASDGLTYYGDCNLKCAIANGKKIHKLHDGGCSAPDFIMKPLYCACAKGAPLCASDGKTYYGDCNLKCAIANGKKIHKVHDGNCSPTLRLRTVQEEEPAQDELAQEPALCECPAGKPLCASDGLTYYGECHLQCAVINGKNIIKEYDGECFPIHCGCAPGKPVCASDGNTYKGECIVKCAKKQGLNIHKVHDGACKILSLK